MELALFFSVVLNAVIIFFVWYLKDGIKAFIEFRSKKEFLKFEKEITENYERKYKAEKVAELFARKFNGAGDREGKFEFEKLNWELALWLPKETVCEISQKLVHGDKFAAMELLIQIRKDLGLDDGLQPENIVYLTDAKNPKPTPKNPDATNQPNDNKD